MEKLMEPERLRSRVLIWAQEEIALKNLPPQSLQILERILFRGELARAEIPEILKLTERQARRITAELIKAGVLMSDSSKAPLNLAFSARYANRWMPGLFPEE